MTGQAPAGAAQAVPADPADRRDRVADALLDPLKCCIVAPFPLKPIHGTCKDCWSRAQAAADAAMAALPEMAAADQLRARLVALVDEMTTKAAELDEDSRAMQAAGDHQASNSLTVRCGMTYFLADRLRALLEET